MYLKVIFYSFKIMKICYVFHDIRSMMYASVPVIQIQPLTPRERNRDQLMCSKVSRATIEFDSPKQDPNLALHRRDSDRISGFYNSSHSPFVCQS